MMPRFIVRLALIVPFAALLSCEHNLAPDELISIAVTRNPDTLAIGAQRQFTAVGTYFSGATAVINNATWSVAASGGGAVNGSGVFTAGTLPGTFANKVIATLAGKSGTATVTVLAGPAANIVVTPNPVTLATNTPQQFTAVVTDAIGNVLSTLPNWSVAAGGGTINTTGLFTTGMAPGTYTNTARASVGSISGSATVIVTAAALATITVTPNPAVLALGATQTFTATGKDASGNTISPLTFSWTRATAAAGSIVATTGVFTAGTTAGTYNAEVTATSGSRSGTATVIVNAGAAAFITVTPNPVTLATSSNRQFTAVVTDAAGNILSILPNWSVAAGGGTINGTGLFTAGTVAGTYTNTARASVGSINGSATVTVVTGLLATVTVTPNPQSLAINGIQQFTAVGRDANGNVVSFTPTWAVVASGGTISSSTGLFTAGTVARTFTNTIRACNFNPCIGGASKTGFATVTVNPGVLAAITVTPNPVTVGTDASQQFTAVGRDASGNIIPILPAPTWSVVAGYAGGTILNPSGVYTAPTLVGVGFDTVRATSGSISGSARVNVSPSGALVAIAVTPNPASVVAGGTVQFTATGFDASGLIVPTPGLAWSVVPAVGGGTIDASTGLFTAGVVDGTFTNAIRAVSGVISGYATVIVNPPPPPGPSLGAAETHGILAGSAITCAGAPGTINADASVWPGSAITGFPPCVITGETHAADAFAQTAQGDLTTAYLELAAMPCGTTISADLGGTTLAEGVYCSTSSVGVTGTVTLTGNANSLFVIRAASTLTTDGNVVLIGGAQPQNVYWWVGSSATLGTGSQWQGNILALTSITLVDNVTLIGRALARNGAVTLGTNSAITLP